MDKIDPKLKKGKERLREARKSMGLTQEIIGERVGLTKSAICRAESEKDKYFLSDDVLESYSRIFHRPLYFWKGEEPNDEIGRLEKQIYDLEKQVQKHFESFKKKYQGDIRKIKKLEEELNNIKNNFADLKGSR